MALTRKKILIVAGSTVVGALALYLAYNQFIVVPKKKKVLAKIDDAIAHMPGGTVAQQAKAAVLKSQVDAVSRALSPTYYKNTYTLLGSGDSEALTDLSKGGSVVMMRPTAQQFADAFYNDYSSVLPNNLDDVLQRIGAIGSVRKMSYISSVFQQKYGVPMGDFFINQLMGTTFNTLPTTLQKIQNIRDALVALPI